MLAPGIETVILNALDHIRGAWRFRWLALSVAWGAALLLWAGVFLIPDTYQASARVFVDTNTALTQATKGISVDADVETQIQRVRQALLGGPQLQKVALEAGLLQASTNPRAQQLVLNKLRDGIEITGGMAPSAGVFTITYKNRSRDKSVQVVDRLLNTFVQGALGGKREGSEQAQQFLVSQINLYERRLSDAEERLADFKRRNVGLMPGTEGDYFTKLQAEMEALDKAKQTLAVNVRRGDELWRQLHGAQIMTVPQELKPQDPSLPRSLNTATRIRETQMKLDELRLRYTDKHPDVIALRETLAELQQRQTEEIEAVRRGDPGAADRLGLTSNPVYQSAQLQYDQAQVDIGGIRAEIADRQAKIATLRGFINTAPEVEAEFARLNRDYDVTKVQYRALLERLEHSRLGEEAVATGIVKFEIIDPPAAGFAPIAPNRALLIAASSLTAVLAGCAVAYLMYLLNPVFVNVRELSGVTGLPVLGSVSMAWLEKRRAKQHRGLVLYAGTTVAFVCAAVAVLVLQGAISQLVRGLLA
jgi:polysaccharide chain length determinant protein (PEP-CTERM system associated)